jgi:hypothetical protein
LSMCFCAEGILTSRNISSPIYDGYFDCQAA